MGRPKLKRKYVRKEKIPEVKTETNKGTDLRNAIIDILVSKNHKLNIINSVLYTITDRNKMDKALLELGKFRIRRERIRMEEIERMKLKKKTK